MNSFTKAVVLAGGFFALAWLVDSRLEAAEVMRKEKDHVGREWTLEGWKQGDVAFPAPEDSEAYKQWLTKACRPYPKGLAGREAWYLKKNGEHWDGPRWHNETRILTPGEWKADVFVTITEPLASKLRSVRTGRPWGGAWPQTACFAPGAEEVTDVYVTAGSLCVLHIDAATTQVSVIGDIAGGDRDGLGAEAAVALGYGYMTPDPITGRLCFIQGERRDKRTRYIEKLLKYREAGSDQELLLPAILDFKEMYKLVKGPGGGELRPVMIGDKRAEPVFAVKTFGKPAPAAAALGAFHVLLHSNVKSYTNLEELAMLNPVTGAWRHAGKMQSNPISEYGRKLAHGGLCSGVDGQIYTCQHGGCATYPMRMWSRDPGDGQVVMLYDSIVAWCGAEVHAHRDPRSLWDGPADAQTLRATSTKWQTQCPRTGAIYNGGWDGTGMRRYYDGFVTTLCKASYNYHRRAKGRPNWEGGNAPVGNNDVMATVAPNGDFYSPKALGFPQKIYHVYRVDWPREQPAYGYGEKFLPKKRIRELMIEYAKYYIANYAELSKSH